MLGRSRTPYPHPDGTAARHERPSDFGDRLHRNRGDAHCAHNRRRGRRAAGGRRATERAAAWPKCLCHAEYGKLERYKKAEEREGQEDIMHRAQLCLNLLVHPRPMRPLALEGHELGVGELERWDRSTIFILEGSHCLRHLFALCLDRLLFGGRMARRTNGFGDMSE